LLVEIKNNDYQLLTMFDELKTDAPYTAEKFSKYDEFIRLAAPREKAYTALMKMIAADLEAMNRRTALEKVTNYTTYFKGKNKRFNNLVMFLKAQE
jgi:hypothetical protein